MIGNVLIMNYLNTSSGINLSWMYSAPRKLGIYYKVKVLIRQGPASHRYRL